MGFPDVILDITLSDFKHPDAAVAPRINVKPLAWIRGQVFESWKWRGFGVFGEFDAFMEGSLTGEQIIDKKNLIQSQYDACIKSIITVSP